MRFVLRLLCVFLSTGCGLGLVAHCFSFYFSKISFFHWKKSWTGGGFLGTLFAYVFVFYGVSFYGVYGFLFLFLFSIISIYITGQTSEFFGVKDDQRIVLDEIVGYWWSIAFLPFYCVNQNEKLFVITLGFILFRIFDMLKIPWKGSQDLPGGYGIMLDDILAGISVNCVLQVFVRFYYS